MEDRIHIKDLLLRTIVGINEDERRKRQDVLINIILFADISPAGASDNIDDAVNYRTITKRVIKMVEASRFYLVERMADEISRICLADPRVTKVRVLVEKPGALRFARSVGVEIVRDRDDITTRSNRVLIALGSNINAEYNMREAVRRLADHCKLIAVSPVYETAPVGKTNQPKFLNAAVVIETPLSVADLKEQVLSPIEKSLGRVRTSDKNAPRTIDLDIALFNYDILDVGPRHIPDPDILNYPHLAIPLADLVPYYVHPEAERILQEIAEDFSVEGIQCLETLTLD